MQSDNSQILASIDSSIQGLLFRTEADYVLKPFVWSISMDGEFNISRLLKSKGNLVAIELDDFLGWEEYLEDFERWEEFLRRNPDFSTLDKVESFAKYHPRPLSERQATVRQRAEEYKVVSPKAILMQERYRCLLEVLKIYTTNLQVYRVVKYDETIPNDDYGNDFRSSKWVFESFKILVGKVRDGCWIGFSPINSHIEFPTRPTPEKFLAQFMDRHELNQELETELTPILDSLTFIIRNCYDCYEEENQYACEFSETEDGVINRLLHYSNFINTWEFEGMALGNTGLEGVSEIEEEDKFDAIDRLLRSHLENLRVHIVGTISIFDIYAIGQAQNGDWLGVSTTAVWT